MNLVVERAPALSALSRIVGVLNSANVIPILSNVLLTAEDGRLTFRATDLTMEMSESVEAAVGEGGAITVPGRLLSDFFKNLPAGAEVKMALDARLAVSAGRARANLATLPVADFPELNAAAPEIEIVIAASDLSAMFDRVSFAQSSESSRYYMCGVYLHCADGRLCMVATDGGMLSKICGPAVEPFSAVIVPSRMVAAMSRLLKQSSGNVTLSVGPNRVGLTAGGTLLTSSVIDAGYPDYQRVIPASLKHVARASVAGLVGAIRCAETVNEDGKGRGVHFDLSPGLLKASRRGADGEASSEIEVTYDGPEVTFAMSARYVLDTIASLDCEEIDIRLDGPQDPMIWCAPDDSDGLAVLLAYRA